MIVKKRNKGNFEYFEEDVKEVEDSLRKIIEEESKRKAHEEISWHHMKQRKEFIASLIMADGGNEIPQLLTLLDIPGKGRGRSSDTGSFTKR
eukprot:10561565-Ditylum_brightwellii.AAC.1